MKLTIKYDHQFVSLKVWPLLWNLTKTLATDLQFLNYSHHLQLSAYYSHQHATDSYNYNAGCCYCIGVWQSRIAQICNVDDLCFVFIQNNNPIKFSQVFPVLSKDTLFYVPCYVHSPEPFKIFFLHLYIVINCNTSMCACMYVPHVYIEKDM